MTEFSISARWYPVFAFPVLLGTILTALMIPIAMAAWERLSWSSLVKAKPSARDLYLQQEDVDLGRGRTLDRVETGSMGYRRRRRSASPR